MSYLEYLLQVHNNGVYVFDYYGYDSVDRLLVLFKCGGEWSYLSVVSVEFLTDKIRIYAVDKSAQSSN